MAELGSIEFRQSGNLEAQATEEAGQDILRGVSQVAQILQKKNEEDILGEFREDLNVSTDQVVSQEQPSPTPTGDKFFDRLQKLKFDAAQGSRQVQDRAALEGRTLLANAIAANPRMRTQLAAEFSLFTRGDPEFFELGMQDVASQATSSFALSEINDIKDQAYGDGVGEFGMDPGTRPFGSKEFTEEYMYFQEKDARRNNATRILAAQSAEDALSVRDELGKWQTGLVSNSRVVETEIEKARTASKAISEALLTPDDPMSRQQLQEWDDFKAQNHIVAIETSIAQLEAGVNRIDLKWAGTPEYDQIVNLKNRVVQEYRVLAQSVTGDNPDTVSIYDTMVAERNIRFELDNPELVEVGMWSDRVGDLLDNVKTLTGSEKLAFNDFGVAIQNTLPDMLAKMRGITGKNQVRTGLDVQALDNRLMEIRRQNPSRELNDNGLYGREAEQTGAIQNLDQLAQFRSQWIETGVDLVPETGFEVVGGETQYMNYLLEAGELPEDAGNHVVELLASKDIVPFIESARQSTNPEVAKLWGDAGENVFDRTGGPQGARSRTQSYQRVLNSDLIPGLACAGCINIDFADIEDGTVRFTANAQEVARLAAAASEAALVERGFTGQRARTQGRARIRRDQNNAIAEARRIAAQLTNIISRDLQAGAHIEYAQNALPEPDYVTMWTAGSDSFESVFGPSEPEENGEG